MLPLATPWVLLRCQSATAPPLEVLSPLSLSRAHTIKALTYTPTKLFGNSCGTLLRWKSPHHSAEENLSTVYVLKRSL